jgi:hypothetical protein
MPTSRIEAFSDGVFAIIITLLVLEIHVPQVQDKNISASLGHSLLAMTPKFLTYILSFLLVLYLVGRTPPSISYPQEIRPRIVVAQWPVSFMARIPSKLESYVHMRET